MRIEGDTGALDQFEDGIVGRQIGNGRTTEPSPCSAAIASNGPR
jgi:hypothetical protein